MKPEAVDSIIDLDAAATRLSVKVSEWRGAGLDVTEPTWRDQGEGWPPKLKTLRAEVVRPDSLGVTARYGLKEGAVVLFEGGWCDVEFWSGDPTESPHLAAPGVDEALTLDAYIEVLDSFIRRFR